MASKRKTTQHKLDMKQFGMKKVEAFNLEKARIGLHRTIEENNEWVREMAKK